MPASRIAGWFVGCVAAGWLLAYNVLRLNGDNPSTAALPALVVGGVAGLVVFAAGAVLVHRLHASGRVVWHSAPPSGEIGRETTGILRAAAYALLAAAAMSLAVGVVMGADWLGIDGARPKSTVLIVVWNLVLAVWVSEEAVGLLRGLRGDAGRAEVEVTGLDSVWFALLLTAVLAGVAYSRDLFPTLQVAFVAVVGLAATVTGVLLWRLRGGRGVPAGAILAFLVALLSILLPALV